MNHYFRLIILFTATILLSGCINIHQENENAKSINLAFVKNIEIPQLTHADSFDRSFSVKSGILNYTITSTEYDVCVNFLTYQMDKDLVQWDSIRMIYLDRNNDEQNDIKLLQKDFKSYEPSKYCQSSNVKITLSLNKKNPNIEAIKQHYLAIDEAKLLRKEENKELKYLSQLYDMFQTNRDVVIREDSIGGREIYIEHRNERNQNKEDRIRLNIEYNNTSRYFCENLVDIFVSNVSQYIQDENNQTTDNFRFVNYPWEAFWLNGEQLTYNYSYDSEMICHTGGNDFKIVIYNEYDEGSSLFGGNEDEED